MSDPTQEHSRYYIVLTDGTITLYGWPFQAHLDNNIKTTLRSYNPICRSKWFRLFPFRSPLLRESRLLSPPQLLRCFSSLGIPPYAYEFSAQSRQRRGVTPFGNLRVKACLTAHRSLSQLATSFIGNPSRGIHSSLVTLLISVRTSSHIIIENQLL